MKHYWVRVDFDIEAESEEAATAAVVGRLRGQHNRNDLLDGRIVVVDVDELGPTDSLARGLNVV